MQKIYETLLLISLSFSAAAQPEANKLVREGVVLHDKSNFTAAIAKYDEALRINSDHILALYEKAYSLMMLKKFKEAIDLCKRVVKLNPLSSEAKNAYVAWGSSLDDDGNSAEALTVYDKGISAFPDFYLLYFNKALTQIKMEDNNAALKNLQLALARDPLHSSSHYYTGRLLEEDNRVPALLSYLTFLSISSKSSERTAYAAEAISGMMNRNIVKEGNKTAIIMERANPDEKTENNFSKADMVLSLMGATGDVIDVDGPVRTRAETFGLKLQSVIYSLAEWQKEGKGFYWKFYAPFFIEMQEKGFTLILSYIFMYESGEKGAEEWLMSHQEDVLSFFTWIKDYGWYKQ